MTAEVAIINRSAIAVAADSAVTVGRDKVHISANKIFLVSDNCPIGAMVYGFAEFGQIPWETIIKIFRKESSGKTFATVKSCRDEFFEFLRGSRFLTEEAAQASFVLFTVSIVESIKDKLKKLSARERILRLEKILKEEGDNFVNDEVSIPCGLPSIQDFRKIHKKNIRVIANQVFSEIKYKYPARLDLPITDMIYAAFSSGYVSEYHSGIVFFGFGENELLPSITRDELDGAPFKVLRLKENLIETKDVGKTAVIIPFADTEVMTSFMEGITNDMKAVFVQVLLKTCDEIASRVVKSNFSLSDDEYNTIETMNRHAIAEIVQNSVNALGQQIHIRNIHPVMKVVESLPKEDMAKLAEALVEVTALKKKVSPDVESVGGPIDVCIVTKGDGLIWIKRKHYFDLSKNLHYLSHRNGTPFTALMGVENDKI